MFEKTSGDMSTSVDEVSIFCFSLAKICPSGEVFIENGES